MSRTTSPGHPTPAACIARLTRFCNPASSRFTKQSAFFASAVEFVAGARDVTVRVTFDAETENSIEQQRDGWQAILNNFKKHVEARSGA